MIEVKPKATIRCSVNLPGSKSVTHRALVAAALADGQSSIDNWLECEDTRCTIDALRELGVRFSQAPNRITVSGSGGSFHPQLQRREIFVGNSGTTCRLMMSILALASGEYALIGTPRMHERRAGGLVKALNALGVTISYTAREGYPPVRVEGGGIRGGCATIDGRESSQYVSSLLLSAPCAQNDVEIQVTGKLVSAPYVDLTLDVMRKFGISVYRKGYSYFKVEAGQAYRSTPFVVESDVSSASYFWAAAAVTGGTVTTKNINADSRQGDMGFLAVIEEMGCQVERGSGEITVHGGPLHGIDADMSPMPDLVPTLAAIAPFAKGSTVIRNVSHLRYKESDRLRAVAREWARLGSRVDEHDDGLTVYGDQELSGTVVDPHDDHRIAMSLAVLGLRAPGIRITNESCVDKSFPGFWKTWKTL